MVTVSEIGTVFVSQPTTKDRTYSITDAFVGSSRHSAISSDVNQELFSVGSSSARPCLSQENLSLKNDAVRSDNSCEPRTELARSRISSSVSGEAYAEKVRR